ncbi:MAG: hypothetical protein QGF72_01425 [Candidatus Poseidoniaceae archaeon]|nr:hypothetical protein [Candidatus Poseidoniaceae archaeon]
MNMLRVYRGGTYPTISEIFHDEPFEVDSTSTQDIMRNYAYNKLQTDDGNYSENMNIVSDYSERPLKLENVLLLGGEWFVLFVIKKQSKLQRKILQINELNEIAQNYSQTLKFIIFSTQEFKSQINNELDDNVDADTVLL